MSKGGSDTVMRSSLPACTHAGEQVHVIPTRGREHESCRRCWCDPVEAQGEPGLFVHRFREVA